MSIREKIEDDRESHKRNDLEKKHRRLMNMIMKIKVDHQFLNNNNIQHHDN